MNGLLRDCISLNWPSLIDTTRKWRYRDARHDFAKSNIAVARLSATSMLTSHEIQHSATSEKRTSR